MNWGDLEVHGYIHGRIPDYPQPDNTFAWLFQNEAALQSLRELGSVSRFKEGQGIPFLVRLGHSLQLFVIANAMNARKYCICGVKARKWSFDCGRWNRLVRVFKNAPASVKKVLITPFLKW